MVSRMKTLTSTGKRYMIGTMYGVREVEVIKATERTVTFKRPGHFGDEIMEAQTFWFRATAK